MQKLLLINPDLTIYELLIANRELVQIHGNPMVLGKQKKVKLRLQGMPASWQDQNDVEVSVADLYEALNDDDKRALQQIGRLTRL